MHHQNSTRTPPRKTQKERNCGGRGEKNEIVGGPAEGGLAQGGPGDSKTNNNHNNRQVGLQRVGSRRVGPPLPPV